MKDDTKTIKDEEVLEEKKVDEDQQGVVEETQEELTQEQVLSQKVEELSDLLKRSVADYRNLVKRHEEEKKEFVKYANFELVSDLLPAFNTLFLAEKYVEDEGLKLTIKHLLESLKQNGVQRIETVGKKYNAHTMEAIATGDGKQDLVLEELRPGFIMNGKTVQAAHVKVGKEIEKNEQ
jgi:molecular chaperone GrpE